MFDTEFARTQIEVRPVTAVSDFTMARFPVGPQEMVNPVPPESGVTYIPVVMMPRLTSEIIKVVVATLELRVKVIVTPSPTVATMLSCIELADTETTVVDAVTPVPETPIPGVIHAVEVRGRVNKSVVEAEVVVVKVFLLTAMAPFEVDRPIVLPSFTFVVSENPT
jgi:hypothetical protein